jgi:hypothetical protein
VIDTIHFTCHRQLRPEVIRALRHPGTFENDEWRVTYATKIAYQPGAPVHKVVLHYKRTNKALMARGPYPNVELVMGQLPAMVYPNNGHVLRHQADIDTAMGNVHRALDSVTERGIPWTDTNRLDVVLNLPVDPGLVMNAFASMRIPFVRSLPTLFEEASDPEDCVMSSPAQTLRWQGKETSLSLYNKTRKACKDHGAHYQSNLRCLRVELSLHGKKRIARFLGDKSSRPPSISRLDFHSLYRHFRHALCQLPAGTYTSSECTLMNLIAKCKADNCCPNGVSVLDWYGQDVSAETLRKTRKLVSGIALKMHGFSFRNILPPHGPPEQLNVKKDGTTEPVWDPSWGPRMTITQNADGFHLVAAE